MSDSSYCIVTGRLEIYLRCKSNLKTPPLARLELRDVLSSIDQSAYLEAADRG